MPASRLSTLKISVSFRLDGKTLQAEQGEPLAQALVAADKLVLARSPKLHRPRGPWCMRGGCDGCLMRVDGVPNVMTCLCPAVEGAHVETQNVVGTRTVDLLRATDWFFPKGIDHHHLLAGVPGLSAVMQSFARRVAGLGTLPDRPAPEVHGGEVSVDALVIGGGLAGIAAASTFVHHGFSVILVDDALSLGGSARALGAPVLQQYMERFSLEGVRVLQGWVAAGVYGASCLIAKVDIAELVTPRALILATGAHDGGLLFENNDLPGIFSARAAATMAASGVQVGARIVCVGQGPFSAALKGHLRESAEFVDVEPSVLKRAEGSSRVGGVVVYDGTTERRIRCDALVVEAPSAPAFELSEQAGGEAHWGEERGFLPQVDPSGQLRSFVWMTGEAKGVKFDPDLLCRDGQQVGLTACRMLKNSG